MGVITIKVFDGIKPIQDATLLKDTEALVANNTRLLSGGLMALKGTTTLQALTKLAPQTIFRYGNFAGENQFWLEFSNDTDVMRSPVANDAYGRVYWTDGGTPRYAPLSLVLSGFSYPGASYTLGVPAPSTAPAILSFTAPTDAVNAETRTYVVTYVSEFGEEGPPSKASALVTVDPRQAVNLINLPGNPGGSTSITKKYLYRSSATGTGAQFQFVAELPIATATYADSVKQAALGEVLATDTWVGPPAGLRGLKLLPNGAAIGFKDNTAYLSEPNLPHAWPHLYPIDAPIVGIGIFRQTAVLLTNSYPYLLSGADPQAMSPERMELQQACVSKQSIVDTGEGVIYASPDGLVSIGAGGVNLLTRDLLSRDQWQAYNPSSIKGFIYENRYHVLFTRTNGTRGMLIFDFSGQGAAMQTCDINSVTDVSAAYGDPRTDTLYLAQGPNIVRFNSGAPLTYTWRSKTFRTPTPTNLSAAMVIASSYPVMMRVYADGVLRQTISVADAKIFRLTSGFRAFDWQFELTGTSDVSQLSVGTSVSELQQV